MNLHTETFEVLDLKAFGELLDRILVGSIPIYASSDGVTRMNKVGRELFELLEDKDNGLKEMEQLFAAIMLTSSVMNGIVRNMELAAAPTEGVQ